MIVVRRRGFLGRELLPAVAERAHGQRVDPGGQAGADDERLDTERAAQRLVLVLGVAQDQGAVAEGHHPGAERLGGAGLAGARLGELEDVGVGRRHVVAQHPAERVAVERSAGELVDTHLRPGRGQGRRGHERPEHRCLVAGHPPGLRRGRGGGPAAAAAGCAAARCVVEDPGLLGLRGERWGSWAGRGRSRRAGRPCPSRPRASPRLGAAVPAGRGGHQASPLRVRLIPTGMVEAANPTSWARSSRRGANPARRIEASRRRPNSVIRSVLGTVTVHTA